MFSRCNLLLCILLMTVCLGAAADGPLVRLKYARFDPVAAEPKIAPGLRSTPVAGREEYYVFQFRGPVEQGWKGQLLLVGAKVFDYVPDFAFLARMTPEAAEKARELPCVRWVGLYHPAYRISPRLRGVSGNVKVTVLLFPGESPGAAQAEIRRAGGIAHSSNVGPLGAQIEATIPAAAAARIAAQKGIAWIEPRVERKLHNDVGRTLMNVPAVWSGAGLFGAGEIVAVCDTGLDTGKLSSISADFAGRVLATYGLGRNNKWDDPHGHGTHVAGSVLGSGALSGSDPPTHSYANSFAGTAPEAQLVFQSVLDRSGNLGGIPSDLNDLFQPPYEDGARIHTNSWGAAVYGSYTTDSRNLDTVSYTHLTLPTTPYV